MGLVRFIFRSRAVTSIEYALVAALIALMIVSAITLVGTNLAALYDQVMNSIVAALS